MLRNGWITKGIKMPSKNEIFKYVYEKPNLSEEVLMYIAEYKMIYR